MRAFPLLSLTMLPAILAASVSLAGSPGPSPYPTAASAWPGEGAIRVFGWMSKDRARFWQAREADQGATVLAGDSLFGGWRGAAGALSPLPVANRAIGGDTSRGLLFRFQEDVLDLHPKAIVLLSGSNDLSARQDVKQTRSNLIELLDMAERALPGVPVVLCTLPPRNHAKAPVDPKRLLELNALIAELARGRAHVAVLDLHPLLADADGAPRAEYFAADQLHLSAAGYQRFRDALLPLLKQFNIG